MRTSNAKHEPAKHAAGAPAAYLSADERRAAGKVLRDHTPRAAHGGWKPPKDRRDPVELLREANEGRIPELIPLRFSRMARSPFAFYRGAAAIMAAELGDAAGFAKILHRLGHAAEPRGARLDFGRMSASGRILQAAEHLADHGAPLVANQVKHVADLNRRGAAST